MFKGMEESAHLTPDKSPDRKDSPIMNLAVPHQGPGEALGYGEWAFLWKARTRQVADRSGAVFRLGRTSASTDEPGR